MGKYEPKTRITDASVEGFLNSIENAERRSDGFRVLEMFKRLTHEEPKMWGPAIIGFGKGQLKYPDGRELDWPIVGFSPRKQNMSLYVICSSPTQAALLKSLGRHTTGVSCLYIKKLSDVDEKVLEEVVKDAYTHNKMKRGSV